MPSRRDQASDAPNQEPIRRSDVSPIADTAKNGRKSAASGSASSRTAPPNARVVKSAYKTGTVSPRDVRAAIKRLRAKSQIA